MDENISIRQLLQVMVEKDASDLYLMAGAPPGYRINGVIRRLGESDINPVTIERLSNDLMNEKQKADFAIDMEMNLSTAIPGPFSRQYLSSARHHWHGDSSNYHRYPLTCRAESSGCFSRHIHEQSRAGADGRCHRFR
ncbi:MAG: hypothetical protein ACE5E3_04230 [Mariprofundus sp.]